MEFGLLGPLVVRGGRGELGVARGRQQALLAALLLHANRVVPVDVLAEALWGADPPPSSAAAVRNYVRRLRQALGLAGAGRISTAPRGYQIRVAEGELDVSRFERLLAAAHEAARAGSWEVAASRAREALALWRGEPLAGVQSETLELREVPRLAERRLQAEELCAEAGLHLGDHARVAAEVQRLAAAHPLREHVRALLMLAYYRCGRQADALGVYQQARTTLVAELGAEPGTELQRLHQQILAADPALDLPQPTAAGGGTRPGAVGGTAPAVAGHPQPPVPRQLPAAVAGFTGRAAELDTLGQILDQASAAAGTVVISAIGGMAGVGKTALAIHWAHQVSARFPDGQLYVNLRGIDPSASPLTPAQAIRGFLDALGVAPGQIPPVPQAQQGLYRSLLAGKKMLIVADNAAGEAQVRPLLPASPGSLVLVTSRRQLAGLAAADGARLLSLDVLTDAEARQMLATRIGADRAAAEPDAVSQITALCGHLPLALAIAAARAAARPGFPLAALAAELRQAAGRLDALDAGEAAASITAVFSWSYQQLTPSAARMFRLLGIHPGPDITIPAAASLAACAYADARRLLGELTRAHLLAEHAPGRCGLHDLLRAYAASQARATDSQPERHAATGRVLDHYLHTGHAADRLLDQARDPIVLASPRPGVVPEQLASYAQAMAWFETEHQVLLAAITLAADSGYNVHAWQMPWTMMTYFYRQGHWQQLAAIQHTAVAAAVRLGDCAALAESRRLLAIAYTRLGDHDQARTHIEDCLELFRQLGDLVGEARAHHSVATLAERQSRYADALSHSEQALRLYQTVGHQRGRAAELNNVGWRHALLGDYRHARIFCQQALTLSSELGYLENEAHSWDSLGYAEHHLGHLAEAADCYHRALSLFRELGDRLYEAEILTHLGDTHQASGSLPLAREAWQQALQILDDLQHPGADPIRAKLSCLDDHGAAEPAAARSAPRAVAIRSGSWER